MRIVELGEIAERLQDGPFGSNLKSSDYVERGVRVIRLQNIGAGHFDDSNKSFISEEHFADLAKHRCEPGDVLLATLGDPILRAAQLPAHVDRALNKADCIQLRCLPDVADHRFITHYLNSPQATTIANTLAHGQTRPRVNLTQLKRLPVPLPPIEEQRRIAAVLDAGDALRAKRRQAIAKLDTLTQAIFIDMFGDPVSNPMGWPTVCLSETGSLDRGVSTHRPRNDPVLLGGQWPLVQTGDVANSGGTITCHSSTYSDVGLAQSRLWPTGTLCITIAANIAKTAFLSFDACFPDSVVGFDSPTVGMASYIDSYLSFLQPILERQAPESAQKNINLRILRELVIARPPDVDIALYSSRVQSVGERKASLVKESEQLDNLFASLQQRAFQGEL